MLFRFTLVDICNQEAVDDLNWLWPNSSSQPNFFVMRRGFERPRPPPPPPHTPGMNTVKLFFQLSFNFSWLMKINSLKALPFFYLQDQKKKERKKRKKDRCPYNYQERICYINPPTYKGGVGGCYSPLGFFLNFSWTIKHQHLMISVAVHFIPRAHFETSLIMIFNKRSKADFTVGNIYFTYCWLDPLLGSSPSFL